MNTLKSLFVVVFALFACNVQAQDEDDNYIFTHLGAGISVGTDGVGIEVAAPCTKFLGIRAGISFIPKITVNINDISYDRNVPNYDAKGSVKASIKKIDGKFLVDFYPWRDKFSGHITVGLFAGTNELITASFKEDPNEPIGGGIVKKIGNAEWMVEPVNHKVDFRLTTNVVKPYVGIGFGRMVPPSDKRIGVSCDLGVQFHGTPEFQGYATAHTATGDKHQWVTLESQDFDFGKDFQKDIDDALKIVHAVKVWPVLNVRITGRIF